ncbi:ATP-binding cassette domain-containing protein [Thalassotalea maritima]|uniref:ABC transporter ATP-binding protein n=1 Tax=Thalassotalea maritima TaxID=3242416 RepID=UPI0035276B08
MHKLVSFFQKGKQALPNSQAPKSLNTGDDHVRINGKNLVVHFNDTLLFSIESLCFAQGDTILLQGENGSGKTTLMKILAGLIHANLGELKVHHGVSGRQMLSLVAHKNRLLTYTTYLHQAPYVYAGSVLDNLQIALPITHRYRKGSRQKLERVAKMAGLRHLLATPATHLSGGEKQRLALARVCLVQPKLLLLDEPTANMDSASVELMLSMIVELQKQNTGLMIVSHQHNALANLCHQHWLLANKRLTVCRKPQEVPLTSSYVDNNLTLAERRND